MILFLFTFSSCANINTKRPSPNPNVVIKKYKEEQEKSDLTQVIMSDGNVDKQHFLKDIKDEKFKFWLDYFTKREKELLIKYSIRGQKYRAYIEHVFTSYGLPKELYYVGLIESGYSLRARSHANAVGPWQFIKATARRYGLLVGHRIDERRSIIKATHAAARYFKDLYNIFGSWELSLSAYNAGEYGMIRRIKKAKSRDYYELSRKKFIPRETRNYVPKILAVQYIHENPSKFGFNITAPGGQDLIAMEKITIKKSISIRSLAKQLGLTKSQLLHINNDIKRGYIPGLRNGYNLFIPQRKLARAQKIRYQKVPKNKIQKVAKSTRIKNKTPYHIHRIRRGDNLTLLAKLAKTTVSHLKKINSLKSSRLYVGQKIKLPGENKKIHTVRNGEYLERIAKKYGVKIRRIQKLNSLKGATIYPGQKLLVSLN